MYNKVILVGNLTRDIELRYSQKGSAVANTAIATSRKFTVNGEKKEETCFVDITFFGRSGEVANQYLRKGSKILVEGRLQFEQWVDQTNGQKRSKHSVIVETMQMLDGRNDPHSPNGYDGDGYHQAQDHSNQGSEARNGTSYAQRAPERKDDPKEAHPPHAQGYVNTSNLSDLPGEDEIPF